MARVLVCTRQALVLEGLRHVLPQGHEMIGAPESGTALLRQAVELRPDILILDTAAVIETLDSIVGALRLAVPGAKLILLNGAHHLESPEPLDSGVFWIDARLADSQLPEALGVARTPVNLTARQTQILRFIAQGQQNKEIAALLGISVKTIEFHRARITHKLGLKSIAQLARFAASHGLV